MLKSLMTVLSQCFQKVRQWKNFDICEKIDKIRSIDRAWCTSFFVARCIILYMKIEVLLLNWKILCLGLLLV